MSGRPALVRQRDVKQVIMAAKKAGALKVEVPIGNTCAIVHLRPTDDKPDEPEGNGGIDL
jgi:hypothetical protein